MDGIRDVQFVGVGSDRPDDSVGPVVLVFQLPTWPFGAPVPSVYPDEVVGLEGWSWDPSDVRVILLSGLGVPHLVSGDLVDSVQAFGCGLGSVFFWVVDTDVQFEVTAGW